MKFSFQCTPQSEYYLNLAVSLVVTILFRLLAYVGLRMKCALA